MHYYVQEKSSFGIVRVENSRSCTSNALDPQKYSHPIYAKYLRNGYASGAEKRKVSFLASCFRQDAVLHGSDAGCDRLVTYLSPDEASFQPIYLPK